MDKNLCRSKELAFFGAQLRAAHFFISSPRNKNFGGKSMALVKCPDCGRDVSGRAIACPYCGCPVSEVITQQRDDSDNFFEQGDKYYRGKGVPQDFQKAAF